MEEYLRLTPTARRVLGILEKANLAPVQYDHLAYRTFGVKGMGIQSIAQTFTEQGYVARDELHFPAKHVKATWFSPPDLSLPRVFLSEIQVEKLDQGAQGIIRKYTSRCSGIDCKLDTATRSLPWGPMEQQDFADLAGVSEYASWVLVNGDRLNHATISVHRLQNFSGGARKLTEMLEGEGIKFSTAGGVLKVSPDGGLVQSSTLADTREVMFAGGLAQDVPGSYMEFAERHVLPEFQHLQKECILEEHRREGFEVANANAIFESTNLKCV